MPPRRSALLAFLLGTMTLDPGQILDGKYRIVKMIGSGGMGCVYEGENARIHRRVAIKVLHASVAEKADVVQRFEREAQAAGRIGSEHIVEVLDLGALPEGERYMVMEFLEGEDLGARIKRRGRLDPREVAPIIYQLLEGLAAAHDAGIIHRDLKPDNVFLLTSKGAARDFVKVLDFGVSKFSVLDANAMSMTTTGAVMGTPYYMSPEQARGVKVDPRSDLYSVGVVMYQAVTGRVPFDAETFNELVFKIALESPHPAELMVPNLDPGFASLLTRAMTRDAGGRFQHAREFQAAIGQWMSTGAGVPTNVGLGASMATGPHRAQPNTPMGFTPQGPQMAPFAAQEPGYLPPGQLGQSAPGFGGSQAGLTVTGAPRSNSGKLIAVIGVLSALLAAGGGFAFYRYSSSTSAAPTTAPTAEPTASAAPEPTAEPEAEAEPESEAEPAASASAEAPEPAESAPPVATEKAPVATAPKPPQTAPPATAKTAPTPTAKPTGRVIGGEL